jgi:tRNA(adenine34) deaminase
MAYQLAQQAFEEDEIPVGAVIVAEGHIIAKAYNQTEKLNDPTAHAEMLALTAAFDRLGSKYLTDCTLYVTLEPCTMCAGALYWAQLKRLVYAADDLKSGFTQHNSPILHPRTTISKGILRKECGALIDQFFKKMRERM